MTKRVRRESSSSGELNQAITLIEWSFAEGNRAGCKLGIFELGAALERVIANSLEVFVPDDAFEGSAIGESHSSDDFKLIGESDALESGTLLECALANSFEVFVADDALEGSANSERQLSNVYELIGESDTREGIASTECCLS